ncbi:MAG TPA: TOBE domain-containing protein [Firmicutes bacterium]|nr:TOBE domain-containing protein [Bacillota bacterium]
MKISGRNKLPGRVTKIEREGFMAQVSLDCGGNEITAVVTGSALDDLGLREGDQATALIKATSVMLIK